MTATYMEFRSLKLLCKTCLIMIAGNVGNATIFNFLFFYLYSLHSHRISLDFSQFFHHPLNTARAGNLRAKIHSM